MLSNEYRKEEIEKRIQALNEIASKNNDIEDLEQNRKNIEAFYVLKGEYLDGTQTAINNGYGSFENYLNVLGVQESEIDNIKQILLE